MDPSGTCNDGQADHAPDTTQSEDKMNEYEEEYPVYMQLLRDLPPTPPYDLPEDELRHMPEGSRDAGWKECLNSVEKYDSELCQSYREQIDTLLVFAGLFSAVVTAFAVESYQWLQDDPLATSVELLRDMVGLLSQNLTITASPPPIPSPRVPDSAVARINTFWFLSLSLSLSAALVGILCKQWLREFERNVGQSPERALAVRYIRFRGIERWKVGSIVMSVPIIMQAALAFFMIGIIDLLWRLHAVVACCVSVVAGLTLVFFLATTFLPAIQYAYISVRCCIKPLGSWEYITRRAFTEPQCAFKSPQAWLVLRLVQPAIERLFGAYGPDFSFRRPPYNPTIRLRQADSWAAFDINWVRRRDHMNLNSQCAFRGLAWIARNLGGLHLSSCVWHCAWARWLKNRDSHDTVAVANLDLEFVARSYPHIVRLDIDNPQHVRAYSLMFQCSLRTDLPVETAIELILRVAPAIGVNSRWTREAVRAILVIYQDISIQINDGLAIGLFRIAEMQTDAVLLQPDGPNSATQLNGALAFKDILVIIYRGSRLRNSLLAAMSALALQWLRAEPPLEIALVARLVFCDMITHLTTRARNGEDWHKFPGIILVAKLADTVSDLWPEFVRQHYSPAADVRRHPPVMQELLAMLSDEHPDMSQRELRAAIAPQSRFAISADGEGSNGPVLDAPAGTHGGEAARGAPSGAIDDVNAGSGSPNVPREHLCIDVHGEETDAGSMENDVNYDPASPGGRATRPASPRRDHMSPESLETTSSPS